MIHVGSLRLGQWSKRTATGCFGGGLESLGTKTKKGNDLSSGGILCSLFGHASDTQRVYMSRKTDRYAH